MPESPIAHDNNEQSPVWFPFEGQEPRIILSSALIYKRNVDGILFPPFKGDVEQAKKACDAIETALDKHPELKMTSRIDPAELVQQQWFEFFKNRSASLDFLSAPATRCARIVLKDNLVCRINDVDHLALQITVPNLQLEDGLKQLRPILDVLETELTFARDPRFGYVTVKPEYCGMGFSAHVHLNLPAIILMGYVSQAENAATELGFRLKFEKDKKDSKSSFLSNIAILTAISPPNRTPEDTLANLTDFALKLEQHELDARRQLLSRTMKPRILDLVGRARALIDGANLISPDEAVSTLSAIWLGNELGIRTNKLKQREFFKCYTELLFQSMMTKHSAFCEQAPERSAKRRAQYLKQLFNPKPQQPKTPDTQQDND